MVVSLPGPQSFNGIPSPRTGRAIATIDTSARARGLEALGRGLAELGANVQRTAVAVAERREKVETQDAQYRLAQFQFEEARRYVETIRDLPPGDIGGFVDNYLVGYTDRVREFRQTLPEHFRPSADLTLFDDYRNMWAAGYEFEEEAQFTYATQNLQENYELILPRVNAAAAVEDNDTAMAMFRSAQQSGIDAINANAILTERQKEAEIQAWLERSERAFAVELDPIRRQELLGFGEFFETDQIAGIEGLGRNPNSTAFGEGQFIEATWLEMIHANRGDIEHAARLAVGNDQLAQQEWILELRDPEIAAERGFAGLGREMIERYRQQNIAYLQQQGHSADAITPGVQYLAHFLGPAGANAILNAAPGARIEDVMSAGAYAANSAVWSNNGIRTVGELMAWAEQKMGNAASTSAPILANIPYEVRADMAATARTQAAALRTNQIAALEDDYNSTREALGVQLIAGIVGEEAVWEWAGQWASTGLLKDADLSTLLGYIETHQGDVADREMAYTIWNNRNRPLDVSNPDDVKVAETILQDDLNRIAGVEAGGPDASLLELLAAAEGDPDALVRRSETLATLANTMARAGWLPPNVADTLEAALNFPLAISEDGTMSPNTSAALGAYDALRELHGLSPSAVEASLSDEALNQLLVWEALNEASGMLGTEDRLALASQLGTADPNVLSVLGGLIRNNPDIPATVVDPILRELVARADGVDPVSVPPGGVDRVVSDTMGGALGDAPTLQDSITKAAEYLTSYRARRQGLNPTEHGDEIEALFEQALNEMVGGVYEGGRLVTGGFIELNGTQTIVPIGVPAMEFARVIHDMEEGDLERLQIGAPAYDMINGIPIDEADIRRGALYPTGPNGTYFVITGVVNGQPQIAMQEIVNENGETEMVPWELNFDDLARVVGERETTVPQYLRAPEQIPADIELQQRVNQQFNPAEIRMPVPIEAQGGIPAGARSLPGNFDELTPDWMTLIEQNMLRRGLDQDDLLDVLEDEVLPLYPGRTLEELTGALGVR